MFRCIDNISELVRLVFDEHAYLDPTVLLPPIRDLTVTTIADVLSCDPFVSVFTVSRCHAFSLSYFSLSSFLLVSIPGLAKCMDQGPC